MKPLKVLVLLSLHLVFVALGFAEEEKDVTAVLLERVKGLWEAKVAGDWDKVYQFTTSEFKRHVSLEQFKKNRDAIIATYVVKNIRLNEKGDRAQVDVEYTAIVSAFPFKNLKAKEEWVLEDGEWRIDYSNPKGIKELFKSQVNK